MVSGEWCVTRGFEDESTCPKSYKDLLVWQKSMELAKQVYLLTTVSRRKRGSAWYPDAAGCGLRPSNIAEGQARHTSGEFVQFLSHAEGSLAELDTQS